MKMNEIGMRIRSLIFRSSPPIILDGRGSKLENVNIKLHKPRGYPLIIQNFILGDNARLDVIEDGWSSIKRFGE